MTSKTTILVVDDEKSLRDFVRRNLQVRGYHAPTAANGMEAMAIFKSEALDLVILDLMMPHMNGLETIQRIRQESMVPIIVLSALGEEGDKLKAFNYGADDYLTKPFGVNELLARVRAVLRRSKWMEAPQKQEKLVKGELVVDFERHEVLFRGAVLDLTPTEFNLLTYLMKHTGKVLSHQAILRHVWGPEYGQEAEYLRVYIGRLRSKIEDDPNAPRYLITERGIGYSFEA